MNDMPGNPSLPIDIRGLSVAYGHKRVLSNIYLGIEPGHLYGLIGPNGAGKSTLFKCILQQVHYHTGEITIFGSVPLSVLRRVAYVPQKDEVDWQFPAVVSDIVKMGRYPYKKWYQRMDEDDHRIIREALEQTGILHLKDHQIGELSGGQQQRVFLARALCQQADILLMDEPFVGVDVATEERMIRILKMLASQGKTILVVHHDLDSVRDYFDRVIMVNQRLVAAGETASVFTRENISRTYSSQNFMLQKEF